MKKLDRFTRMFRFASMDSLVNIVQRSAYGFSVCTQGGDYSIQKPERIAPLVFLFEFFAPEDVGALAPFAGVRLWKSVEGERGLRTSGFRVGRFLYLNFHKVFTPEPTKNRDSVEFIEDLPRNYNNASNDKNVNSRPSRKGVENAYSGDLDMLPMDNVGEGRQL